MTLQIWKYILSLALIRIFFIFFSVHPELYIHQYTSGVYDSMNKFRDVVYDDYIYKYLTYFQAINSIREYNNELLETIENLKIDQNVLITLQDKIAELESQLNYYNKDLRTVVFVDIHHITSTFHKSGKIYVSAGENKGIKKGDILVFNKYLLGIIDSVYDEYALASSIYSNNINVPVKSSIYYHNQEQSLDVENEYDYNLITSGVDGKYMYIKYNTNSKIMKNQILISSGLGGIYPPGLIVGKVIDDNLHVKQIINVKKVTHAQIVRSNEIIL